MRLRPSCWTSVQSRNSVARVKGRPSRSARAKTAASTAPNASPGRQLEGFLAKFDPSVANLLRACRTKLRRLLPTAIELVYDNYNFFVIGYAPTERASDTIVSLAAAANGG